MVSRGRHPKRGDVAVDCPLQFTDLADDYNARRPRFSASDLPSDTEELRIEQAAASFRAAATSTCSAPRDSDESLQALRQVALDLREEDDERPLISPPAPDNGDDSD